MKTTAIAIAADMSKLVALLETSDEITPEMVADTMEGLEFDLGDKLDSIYSIVRNLEGLSATCDTEAARLSARKKSFENRIKGLKKYVLECLIAADKNSFKTAFNTFTARKGIERVIIDNEDKLPNDFVEVITTVAPDRKAIKEAFAAGIDVPGAHIETGERSLQVR